MRILYHHRTLGDGAEGIHIAAMVTAFRKAGHEVEVVSLVGERRLVSDRGGARIPDQGGNDVKTQRSWFRRGLSMIASALPGIAYEFAELAYNFAGRAKLNRAIKRLDPDLIYDRYNTFSNAAVDVGRANDIPVCLEVNAPVALERTMAQEQRPLRMTALAERYERKIFQGADRVVVVSTPLKQYLIEQRGVPAERILLHPNGADPQLFSPDANGERVRQQYGLENQVVIGFVGILRPWHGVDLLIDAFLKLADLAEVRLLIVGDGPAEQQIQELAQQHGLTNRCTFTGRVAHDEMVNYLAAIDISVSPRATFYASPMKIVEAMAMGRPVVAADTPNIRDMIDDGVEGLLFRPDCTDSLADCLRRLANDPELRQRLGAGGRRRVEGQLNWDRIAADIVSQFTP